DEQHKQFISVFKKSLFSAYATAFLALDGETITIHPYTKPLKTKATIKMDVHAADGTVYPISYSMHLTKDNTWKVKNVIAGPLNLGLTFKNLFLDLMSKYRDVDLAIENWSSDVPKTTT
ncbi:MAG: ABC transporter substrate-binding protein, partial [Pseudomonadales bacterium]|nr:ABC transporter substrate-binding protein [Pseudomonadales bacterium]